MKLKKNTLVCSGGGIRGIYQLGCLHYLYQNDMLTNITNYVGSSIGSIINLLISIGYTPEEIFDQILNKTFFNESNIQILKFPLAYGLFDQDIFFDHIRTIVIKKLNYIPTLQQLVDNYGIYQFMTSCNLTTQKLEYLSYKSYPDLDCVYATRMSSSVPIMFNKTIYNNNLYVDGGICNNYPITYLDNGENDIIGLHIASQYNSLNSNKQSNIKQLMNYLISIISLPFNELYSNQISKISNKCTNIDIKLGNTMDMLDIGIDTEQKKQMFYDGYKYLKNYNILSN